MTMPFGPYNGRLIAELPDSYLFELIERQCRSIKPLRLWSELAEEVDAEYSRRCVARNRRAA